MSPVHVVNFKKLLQVMRWSTNAKIGMWHEFIHGMNTDEIALMFGGKPEQVDEWIRDVCAGREECIYAGSWIGWKWTPRLDRLMLRMKRDGLRFNTACRLLGFTDTNVRQRLAFLCGETDFDQNDHLCLSTEEWNRYYRRNQ